MPISIRSGTTNPPVAASPDATLAPRLSFRPDIEGLRALAILLVVAAHAGLPGASGGFIGVDVFFVISGYLITGLLQNEQQDTGRIALARFYARRLLRLLPALVVVIWLTCIAAALLLAPFEHPSQAGAAIGATTWTSNFAFALADLDYFGPSAKDNLFLHTWSLGVEEQFYLVWPLLLVYLASRVRRARHGWSHEQRLALDIALLGALALAASLWLTHYAPRLGFYMPLSRAWQFALGALVFLLIPGVQANGMTTKRMAVPLAILGLMVLIACAAVYGPDAPYPGWRAIGPSVATAALIAAGLLSPRNPVTQGLSRRPLLVVGGLSYAWYLWHWPVLLLGHAVIPAPGAAIGAALVALSLGLAFLTQRFVERPVRHASALASRPVLVIVSALLLSGATVGAALEWRKQAEQWADTPLFSGIEASRRDGAPIYAANCDQWFHSDELVECIYGSDTSSRVVVLLGDSVAAQWFSAVRAHFPEDTWRLVVMTKSACPMVDLPFHYARIGRRYVECERWRDRAIERIGHLEPDALLFGSSSNYPFSAGQWLEGSANVMDALAAASVSSYLILPVPGPAFDAPTCVAREEWRRTFGLSTLCVSRESDPRAAAVRAALAEQARTRGIHVIDMSEATCPAGWCRAVIDGVIAYRDGQHLSESQVLSSSPRFGAAIEAADTR